MAGSDRVVIPKRTVRDVVLAALLGFAVLGFLVFAFSKMGASGGGWKTGTVLEKKTVDLKEVETQITIGAGGPREKVIKAEHTLIVRGDYDGKEYEVVVDPAQWEKVEVGQQFRFYDPPGK